MLPFIILTQVVKYLLFLFPALLGAPVGKAIASFSFAFSFTTRIVGKLLKTTRHEKKIHHKFFMLARSKLNIIEILISLALINSDIGHVEYTTIINEEEKYWKLKEDIRIMKSQRRDAER